MTDLIPVLLLLAFSLVFVGALFLILRSLVLWYFRINERLKAAEFTADMTGQTLDELRAIRYLLEAHLAADHAPSTSQATHDTEPSPHH